MYAQLKKSQNNIFPPRLNDTIKHEPYEKSVQTTSIIIIILISSYNYRFPGWASEHCTNSPRRNESSKKKPGEAKDEPDLGAEMDSISMNGGGGGKQQKRSGTMGTK